MIGSFVVVGQGPGVSCFMLSTSESLCRVIVIRGVRAVGKGYSRTFGPVY